MLSNLALSLLCPYCIPGMKSAILSVLPARCSQPLNKVKQSLGTGRCHQHPLLWMHLGCSLGGIYLRRLSMAVTMASIPFGDIDRSSWETWIVLLGTLLSPGKMLGRGEHSKLMSRGSADCQGMEIQLKKVHQRPRRDFQPRHNICETSAFEV